MCKEELLNRVETSSSWQEVPPQAQMRQSRRTTLRVSLQVFLFIGFGDTDDGEMLHIHTFCSRCDGGATLDSRRETFFKEKNKRHNMVCTLRRDAAEPSACTRPVTPAWVSARTPRRTSSACRGGSAAEGNRTLNVAALLSGCKRRNMCALLVIPHDSKSPLRDSSHSGWENPTSRPVPPQKKKKNGLSGS